MELGSVAPAPAGDATGLAHVAFKVGNSLEEFGLARSLLDESGTSVLYEAQRGFAGACTCSIRTETRLSFTSTSQATDPSGLRDARGQVTDPAASLRATRRLLFKLAVLHPPGSLRHRNAKWVSSRQCPYDKPRDVSSQPLQKGQWSRNWSTPCRSLQTMANPQRRA